MTMTAEPRVRLFFALWPASLVRERIAAAAQALPLGGDARGVPEENYHATVAFIGEVPATALPSIRDLGAALRSPHFELSFTAYEYWPKPEVVVAAARTIAPALQGLWQNLHAGLNDLGLALAPKRLRPHITLARNVAQQPLLRPLSSFDWPVETFSLVRSDTGGARSIYTVQDTWPLLYEPAKP